MEQSRGVIPFSFAYCAAEASTIGRTIDWSDAIQSEITFQFLQWDGKKWNVISDWIASDQSIVRPMVEASAAQYAKEKGITPRDCSKEN